MRRVFLLAASDVVDAMDRAIEEATRGDYRMRARCVVVTPRGDGWFLVVLSVWRSRR